MRMLFLLALLAGAGAARAQDDTVLSGTLKAINERGTILIGTRDSAVPFSFGNKAGQAVGFSVDICREIAADVAAALHQELLEPEAPRLPGIRVVYVKTTADERLPKLTSGAIDLECGSTTANAEREKTIAFSPVFFLAGTKLLVPANSPVDSYLDLHGRTVVVSAGTTNAMVMARLVPRVTPPFNLVEAPDLAAAYDMLAAGRADAFASDDVLLAGLKATRSDGRRFRLVGDYLSFEPYAIGLRKDDPMFADLVRDSFARMAQEGTLRGLYNRWFNRSLPGGDTLNLPMSAQLSEMYRTLGEPD